MTAYNVIDRAKMATGQAEDITVVLANLDAIAAVLNGNIDSSNILDGSIVNADVAAGAAIGVAKLAAPPRAKVSKSAAQTIATSTATAVAFDNEVVDNDTIHDNVTNNNRLTCKTAGLYLLMTHIVWDGVSAAGERTVQIRVNGGAGGTPPGPKPERRATPNGGGAATHITCVDIVPLVVNDYAEVIVSQNSGGNLDVRLNEGGFGAYTTFEMVRIST